MAPLKLTRFRLLFLYVLSYYVSEQRSYSRTQSSFTEALLYHQFQPVVAQPSPLLTRFNRQQPQLQNVTTPIETYYLDHSTNIKTSDSPAPSFSRRQRPNDQSQISYLTSRDSTDESTDDFYGCPVECHCNRIAQIADCSNRNLTRVPSSFPREIKRIRLERNNITEIGPNAFQGLKRLQRIDLSNNNLFKIDPLAFSGGLQALNSLILYSNKLEHLPVNVFNELTQLQLLLLNANSLQNIHKDLFQSLANLNLLSLYDNKLVSLASGTFDGLKGIKTIHLGKNPLNCDCNSRWLIEYFEANPVETSEARCETPSRAQGRKLSQLNKNELKCQEPQPSKPSGNQQYTSASSYDQSTCPAGCVCNGSTVDCSRAPSPPSESRSGSGSYELPDIPDDVPVYVARVHINDNRIKKIRQTGLFRRLANSQKLDLGNNKIIDIEDNAINGQFANGKKPDRVVFVLLENQHCGTPSIQQQEEPQSPSGGKLASRQHASNEDPCYVAPKVNDPQFDSPCYNGGICKPLGNSQYSNYSCTCPVGFAGPLCEINIDDCIDHQCQNGAMCVDGINSYKCICRDPTTTGEFCEQLNQAGSQSSSYAASSANSIAPIALPMVAAGGISLAAPSLSAPSSLFYDVSSTTASSPVQRQQQRPTQQILARSADLPHVPDDLASNSVQHNGQSNSINQQQLGCHRITQRKYFDDGNGCQSVRVLKISECAGPCNLAGGGGSGGAASSAGCCQPAKMKRRRIRMQCSDGASYVKTIDLVKKCACTDDASCPALGPIAVVTSAPTNAPVQPSTKIQREVQLDSLSELRSSRDLDSYRYAGQQQQQLRMVQNRNSQPSPFTATQDDQMFQITRLDAVD